MLFEREIDYVLVGMNFLYMNFRRLLNERVWRECGIFKLVVVCLGRCNLCLLISIELL